MYQSRLRRFAALVGLLGAMVGVIALAAPAQAASAPGCKGSSCSNKDPQSTGCGKDARTIDKIHSDFDGLTVELRRSRNCSASWARLTSKAGNWWDFRLEVKNGPYYAAFGSPKFKAYTRMSGSTQPYRACIKQYGSDTWLCTRWHPKSMAQPAATAAQPATSAPMVPTLATPPAASAARGDTGAATTADTLCNVNQNTWVRKGPGTQYDPIYTIPAGGGFRITGPRTGGWVLGHGNGGTEGYIPNDGRLEHC